MSREMAQLVETALCWQGEALLTLISGCEDVRKVHGEFARVAQVVEVLARQDKVEATRTPKGKRLQAYFSAVQHKDHNCCKPPTPAELTDCTLTCLADCCRSGFWASDSSS